MEILYKTIHGSRLYGLAHEDSDYDWYTVVAGSRKTSQKITGDQDNTIVDFGTFVRQAQTGAPQALEAMFSTQAEVDHIAAFRAGFRAGTNYDAYRGIMKRIALTPKWDDDKHRRLVLRLGMSMSELRRTGRFDPTLSRAQAMALNKASARWTMEHSYRVAKALAHRID